MGKTIEMIALILLNPRKSSMSKTTSGLKTSSSTLIIVPVSCITQWVDAVRKFAPSLTAAAYYGNERADAAESRADVVVTSFGTLVSEYKSVVSAMSQDSCLSFHLFAMVSRSFLFGRKWWRVVVDEGNIFFFFSLFFCLL